MSRIPFVAGNWKMHKTVGEAETLIQGLLPRVAGLEGVEIAICPPYTALTAMIDSARGSRVAVFAQNMHDASSGAFTGEISAAMLLDLEVAGVIIGHSERRALFAETDAAVARKLVAALGVGLSPILCVGESEAQRLADETESHLRTQLETALEHIDPADLTEIAIAYEPIWAIGTGQVATPEQAQDACSFVRGVVAERSEQAAAQIRVLYGGSVSAENAAELLALPDVDGALVGGASLTAEAFGAIAAAARPPR
jgi:triosephosphate isomerase (TIM)